MMLLPHIAMCHMAASRLTSDLKAIPVDDPELAVQHVSVTMQPVHTLVLPAKLLL